MKDILNLKRQKSQRGVTSDELAYELLNNEISSVVVVAVKTDGTLVTGYSCDNNVEAIGLVELAKGVLVDDLNYVE